MRAVILVGLFLAAFAGGIFLTAWAGGPGPGLFAIGQGFQKFEQARHVGAAVEAFAVQGPQQALPLRKGQAEVQLAE